MYWNICSLPLSYILPMNHRKVFLSPGYREICPFLLSSTCKISNFYLEIIDAFGLDLRAQCEVWSQLHLFPQGYRIVRTPLIKKSNFTQQVWDTPSIVCSIPFVFLSHNSRLVSYIDISSCALVPYFKITCHEKYVLISNSTCHSSWLLLFFRSVPSLVYFLI